VIGVIDSFVPIQNRSRQVPCIAPHEDLHGGGRRPLGVPPRLTFLDFSRQPWVAPFVDHEASRCRARTRQGYLDCRKCNALFSRAVKFTRRSGPVLFWLARCKFKLDLDLGGTCRFSVAKFSSRTSAELPCSRDPRSSSRLLLPQLPDPDHRPSFAYYHETRTTRRANPMNTASLRAHHHTSSSDFWEGQADRKPRRRPAAARTSR
jgi:hypothetical protein